MIFILPLLVLSTLVTSRTCQPFGTRLQYGQILVDPQSSEKVTISFNTNGPCDSSYIRILGSSGLFQVPCESSKVTGSKTMNYFTTYVQQCSLNSEVRFGERFFYNIYGWSGGSDSHNAGFANYIQVTMVDPVNVKEQVNVLVMGDWGVIKKQEYLPIGPALEKVMGQFDFKLLLLAGDIAYDLDSNNGTNYVEFLKMAQDIISKIPFVIAPGNHQNYSEDDKMLLNSTFNVYNISLSLAFGFRFADSYIVPFDPFAVAYKMTKNYSSLAALTKQLEIASKTDLFIIPISHYPLTCSAQERCQDVFNAMGDYYKAMIDHGASLYLSGHAHLYQRIYPYFANKTFKQLESPYRDDQGYIVSIIEGAAGNNDNLISDMPKLKNFTAKYTVSQTGFGIMTLNQGKQIKFQHYARARGFYDSIVIEKTRNRKFRLKQHGSSQKLRRED